MQRRWRIHSIGLGALLVLILIILGVIWIRSRPPPEADSEPVHVHQATPTPDRAPILREDQTPVRVDWRTPTTADAVPIQPGTPEPAPTIVGMPQEQVFLPFVGAEGDSVAEPPRVSPYPGPERVAATPTPVSPSPTLAPTPTRRPLRVTKLGVGLYDSGGRYLSELDRLRPSVILLMDPNVDFAREVRRWFPQAFIVGRIFAQHQPLDNPAARGAAFADRVAQKAVPLKGVVDAWMSYNEVTGHRDYDTYIAYNTFQIAFANRLQNHYGIAAVAGNDASATVDPEDYAKYFAEAISTSRYFGIHAYSPPQATSMRSSEGQELMLRYRQIHQALARAGVKHGPFIITEAGLWDGWLGVASERSMAEDFIWYAEELARDDNVIGMTLFGLFHEERWERFNIAGTAIIAILGEYNTEPPQ